MENSDKWHSSTFLLSGKHKIENAFTFLYPISTITISTQPEIKLVASQMAEVMFWSINELEFQILIKFYEALILNCKDRDMSKQALKHSNLYL